MNIQDLLTIGVIAIPTAYAALIAIDFLAGLIEMWKLSAPQRVACTTSNLDRETPTESEPAATHPQWASIGALHQFDKTATVVKTQPELTFDTWFCAIQSKAQPKTLPQPTKRRGRPKGTKNTKPATKKQPLSVELGLEPPVTWGKVAAN